MKKTIIKTLSFMVVALLMTSCNKQPSKMDSESVASGADYPSQGMRIAYIEVDSIISQYEYAKIMKDSLEKMRANATTVLSNKDKELERSANSIQSKLQNNGFQNEQQYKNAMSAFEQERNNRVALEARLGNELDQKQNDFLKHFQDSLNNFLADYNKDKKFDIILNKATILYAEKKYDITQDVINGLNSRYKK